MVNKKIRAKRKKTYASYLEDGNINVPPVLWIIFAITLAVIMGFLTSVLFSGSPSIPIMTVIITPLLIIGLPIIRKEHRDIRMEEAIPDVFEELSTSLRAGATIEQAIIDLTKIQKGPLIDQLSKALNDMEGGFSFEESLENLIGRVDIVMLKRIFTIVIDGRKAGGELADILDSVASDARQMSRITRERRSKTVLYVIFILMAGAFIAPLIFGFLTQIAAFVANVGSSSSGTNPLNLPGTDIGIFWIYLLIETFISGIMLAIVRGIRLWKGLIFYSLVMALIGTIIFELFKWFASGWLPTS